MPTITTKDGTTIFYKDWGPKNAQPLVFHHGWPLSGDDWDAQLLYFLGKGFRVIAHDRRGHGRSSQVDDGHDMDHYASDVAAVVSHLDLSNAVHVGHSTGGGEALHYAARHGGGRVARLVLIGAVPPIMVKTAANPGGLPIEVFDGFRQQLAANRAEFYRDVASGPFYGYNRPGANVSQPVIDNWWRQGMMGGAKAHYDGIKAFSENVTRLPGTGERWQVSSAGGVQPRWRGNGRELFYLAPDGSMMSVAIAPGQAFVPLAPRRLFSVPEGLGSPILDEYGVTADGQRFLVAEPIRARGTPPINVIVNWSPQLP